MLACWLVVGLSTQARSEDEIAAVRITDTGGSIAVRHRLDEWRNGTPGGETFQRSPIWEEELSLRASGYVYHPALLSFEVSGGPLWLQYGYESEAGDSRGSDTLFNFDVALDFLERKDVPFTVYYRRDHPEVTTGLSGRFLAETDEYGVTGVVRQVLSPAFLSWQAGHWESEGSGFGTIVDEQVDRASLQATLPYRGGDNLRLNLNWNTRNSRSGVPGLPIQESEITTKGAELDTVNMFGGSNQASLRQNLNWTRQSTLLASRTELETLGYTGGLRWRHSDSTRSFANARYADTSRTDSWSRTGHLRAGVTHDLLNDLLATVEGGFARDQAPAFKQDISSIRGSANYTTSLPTGSLGLAASLALDRTDQRSDTDRITVFDEPVVLAGTTPVPLAREFVIQGTVVVTNVSQTQTFQEDVDYRLTTVGSSTTIERLITGSILDGQTVLVTYDVLAGGTVSYDTVSQSLSASVGLFRYLNLFLQYNDSSNKIKSGIATRPLNDLRRLEAGGRVDYPFQSGWSIGAEYRYTDQNEDIAPYLRSSYDVFARTGSYWNTTAWLGVHWETVDNENSDEDVDLVRYILRVTSRLPGGLMLAYNAEYSEDVGGTLLRRERRHGLRLDWSYRQVRFALRADVAEVVQGDNTRDYTRVTAEIRRVF